MSRTSVEHLDSSVKTTGFQVKPHGNPQGPGKTISENRISPLACAMQKSRSTGHMHDYCVGRCEFANPFPWIVADLLYIAKVQRDVSCIPDVSNCPNRAENAKKGLSADLVADVAKSLESFYASPYASTNQWFDRDEDCVIVEHTSIECPIQALHRMEPFFRQHLENWRPGAGRWLIVISEGDTEASLGSTSDDDWVVIHNDPKWLSMLKGSNNMGDEMHLSMLTAEPYDQVLTLRFTGTGTSSLDIHLGADDVAPFSSK
jgi:hypothetical protein